MFDHFEACKKFVSETSVDFSSQYATHTIAKLREEFRTRFDDFDHAPKAEKIKLLQSPFTSGIENIPTELQLQFIELTANKNLNFKECYKNADLQPFYRLIGLHTFYNHSKFLFNNPGSCFEYYSSF